MSAPRPARPQPRGGLQRARLVARTFAVETR